MKLTKHQKQIVNAIIAGTVFDIPSYLREFNKWHLCKYDLSRPLAKFEKDKGGKQHKVIIDKDKFYIQTKSPMNTGFGTYYVNASQLAHRELYNSLFFTAIFFSSFQSTFGS